MPYKWNSKLWLLALVSAVESSSSLAENIIPHASKPHSGLGWTALRFAMAGIILTAAILKAWQLATMPSLGEGLLHARWFNMLVVEFELLFGIWLLVGMLPNCRCSSF